MKIVKIIPTKETFLAFQRTLRFAPMHSPPFFTRRKNLSRNQSSTRWKNAMSRITMMTNLTREAGVRTCCFRTPAIFFLQPSVFEFFNEPTLLVGQGGRKFDIDFHVQIALPLSPHSRKAMILDPHFRARQHASRNF